MGDTQGRLHLLRRERERERERERDGIMSSRTWDTALYLLEHVLSIFVILCSFQLLTDDVWPLGGE